MKNLASLLVLAVVSGASTAGYCDEALLTFGGDQFSAGQVTTIAAAVEHDAFALGNDVTLSGTVAGDAHLAGYDVDVSGAVVGDLYAAGFSVNATASVGGDLNAAANVVTITSTASVGGNARLAAATVTLAAPVSGAALITAKSLTLNAPVSGDFSFYGENLTFGPNARVDGQLHIRAPREIAVPSSVAAADRVQFQLLEEPDYVGEAGKSATGVVARFWPVFWTMAAWWLLLVLVGAAFIALLPRAVTAMQVASERHPFRKLGLGFLAFAAVLGLVPALALTVVGILLIPFILIFVVVACSLAYLAGAFFIGMKIASAFLATDTNLKRLGVLAVALIAAALGGMIPVVGWLITLVVVMFGFGTATTVAMVRWSRPEVVSLGSSAQPAQ